MDDIERLEFAAREYEVATRHLLEVFMGFEDVPPRIARALDALATAINECWE